MIPQETETLLGALCTCVHAQNPKLQPTAKILLSLLKAQERYIVFIDAACVLCCFRFKFPNSVYPVLFFLLPSLPRFPFLKENGGWLSVELCVHAGQTSPSCIAL